MANSTKIYRRFKYSEENLYEAIHAVQEKQLTLNAAARKYGVPKATLSKKLRNVVPIGRKMGPAPVLSTDEETVVANWIIAKAKLGFPMHPNDVLDCIQQIMKATKRPNPFKDDRPGRKWLKLFLDRHKEVKKRNTEIISRARANVTEQSIRKWFTELREFIKEEGYEDVIEEPNRIFNADETGVRFCPKSGKLLGPKQYKNFYEISSGPEKENLTVLCNYSASGLVVPPMIVYPYQRIPRDVVASIPEQYFVGRSTKGWMVAETFFEYITNCFYPWLLDKGIQLPIILFLDGHKSHINIELFKFCQEKKIILYCLLPNATHILQPCDVTIFKPLKQAWKKVVLKHKQRTKRYITKVNFAPLFAEAFENSTNADLIQNGFRSCGLFPLDENGVDYSKCLSNRENEIVTEEIYDDDNKSINEYEIVFKVMDAYSPNLTTTFLKNMEQNLFIEDSLYKFWQFCYERTRDGHTKLEQINVTGFNEEEVNAPSTLENDLYLTESFLNSIPIEFEDIAIEQDGVVNILPEELNNDLKKERSNSERGKQQTKIESSVECSLVINDNIPNELDYTKTDDIISNDCDTDVNEIDNSRQQDKNEFSLTEESNNLTVNINNSKTDTIIKKCDNEIIECSTSDCTSYMKTDTTNNSNFVNINKSESTKTDVTANKCDNGSNKTKTSKINIISNVLLKPLKNPQDKSVWEGHLHWPENAESKINKKKCSTRKVPYAISSKKWKNYYDSKVSEKRQKELETQKRKLEKQRKITQKTTTKRHNNNRKEEVAVKKKRNNMKKKETTTEIPTTSNKNESYDIGDFVLVSYKKKLYPGVIKAFDNYGEFEISTMERRTENMWKWPLRPDQIWYTKEAILKKIDPPLPCDNMGNFSVPDYPTSN